MFYHKFMVSRSNMQPSTTTENQPYLIMSEYIQTLCPSISLILCFLDVFYVCGLSEFMWCIFIFLDSDWKIWIQISWDHISLPRSGEMRRHIRVQGSSIGGSKKTMGGYWLASSFFFLKTVFSPVNLYLVP